MGANLLAIIIVGVFIITGNLPGCEVLGHLDAHSDEGTNFTPDESDINSDHYDSWRDKRTEGFHNDEILPKDADHLEHSDNYDGGAGHSSKDNDEIMKSLSPEDSDMNHSQKEQHKLKISKLILSGKKMEDGINPFSPKKDQTEEPSNKQAWSAGIVTSDGGLLYSQKSSKPTINEDPPREVKDVDSQEHGHEQISEEEEDRKIMEIPRFQDLKRHFVARYLSDHYKEQQPSEKLLGQISDLITSDLKQQWKKWLRNDQIYPDGRPKENQSNGLEHFVMKDKSDSSLKDTNEDWDEKEKRAEKSRTTKSILSDMIRSSQLSSHHEKGEDSQVKINPTEDTNDEINDIFKGENLDKTENDFDRQYVDVDKNERPTKMYKKGDHYDLNIMSHPDPKIQKLVKVPMFNQLRRQQIDSYLDAQYGDNPFTEEDLRKVDDVISENMIKDLKSENSGLLAWLQDGRTEEEKQTDEEEERRFRESSAEYAKEKNNDQQDNEEAKASDSKIDSDEERAINGAGDVIKSKRKKLMKILSSGQQNASQLVDSSDEENERKESVEAGVDSKSGEDKKKDKSVEGENLSDKEEKEVKTDDKGVLDSIWGFFSGASSGDDLKDDQNVEIEGDVSDSRRDDEESEGKGENLDNEKHQNEKKDLNQKNEIDSDQDSGADSVFEKDTNRNIESNDDHKLEDDQSEGDDSRENNVSRDDEQNQERSDSPKDSSSTGNVDLDDEKSNHQRSQQDNETTPGVVEEDEEDPLKKLCKKYPTLKACQSSVPSPSHVVHEVETETREDPSIAFYIKYFTRSINNLIYGIFSYTVGCVKSLLHVLCRYTLGMFLNLIGRDDLSLALNLTFETVSIERFFLILFVVVNHIAFIAYYKNSTMNPFITVTDDMKNLDTKQMKNMQEQVNVMREKMALVRVEKEKFQKKVNQEMENCQNLSKENIDLKLMIEESKEDKKHIKELEKSIKNHENRIKGKDNELEKMRVIIETVKSDMKNERDNLKQLEDKYKSVAKELDAKDQSLYDLEENKKEMIKAVTEKEKEISEKADMLSELNDKMNILQSKLLDLEEGIRLEREAGEVLELEKKNLQETLLNIDKLNYEGKFENGWNHSEYIEDEDGMLNLSLNEDMKSERLQNIINAIKLKAEHFEAVSELSTCKTDLENYRNKSNNLEDSMQELSSKFEILSSECEELRKSAEKKDIELQTITKFFGERETEYKKQNVSQKEELQRLTKDMASIDQEKREMSDLLKKIESLREEIATNDKDYKQQIANLEEQNHQSYLKMRNALRECDEHKREKEVYRKRLLDIDMSSQAIQPKVCDLTKNELKDRAESPGSEKAHDRLSSDRAKVPSPSEPKPSSVPPSLQPSIQAVSRQAMPPVFPGMGGLPPMPPGLYRGPPVGPFRMPPMPPMPPQPHFMPRMRPSMPLGKNVPP